LLARIRAVMRRAQSTVDHGVLQVDDLELKQSSRTLLKSGAAVELTSTEFSILQTLLQHQGEVVSKRDLYISALGREPAPHDRSVDMHVSNLRRKLGLDQDGQNRIETIRGIGYQYRIV
jgi:two-component system response regulator CpxR